jgi:predicted unusual protein kinase regulating ubiquinone biosynthesis (AarF/ABC1/UbiB family)
VFVHVRRFRRSFRVARTGARIYLGYKRTQRRVKNLPQEQADAEWERRHEQFAEAIYRLAVDLKGMYIKSGQFLGTRSDVVPLAYVKSLSRLQDRVPPRPVEVVKATIEAELGKPVEELFHSFDDTPIAAASLAQVHRAELVDGRSVAVKVQYPEVAALVRLDLRNLKTLVGIIARREPNFDYRAIVNELASQVPLELDFRREAEMTKRVAHNLAGIPRIELPRVVEGMVSEKVLVTEFLEGDRLIDRGVAALKGADGEGFARALAGAYGHQIMVDGLFQADPHPGNILVLPGQRVGLLDFGLTKELSESARMGFARLVMAASDRDPEAVVEAFAELGVKARSDHPDDLMMLMGLFFDRRPEGSNGVGAFASDRREALKRSPIDAIPGDLVLLGRVVGLLRGVCSSLGTPLTPMQMLRPHAEQVLGRTPSAEEAAAG